MNTTTAAFGAAPICRSPCASQCSSLQGVGLSLSSQRHFVGRPDAGGCQPSSSQHSLRSACGKGIRAFSDSRKQARHNTKQSASASAAMWDVCFDDGNVRICHTPQQPKKQIMAEVRVYASVEEVWRVLTDFERLAEFIPNLARCERVGGAPPGRVHLRQRGCSQGTLWRLEASALLELRERRLPNGARELHFTQLEGDFKEFSGRWVVEPRLSSAAVGSSLAATLRYEITCLPQLPLPSALVAHIVRWGLPANLSAVARRAELLAQRHASAPKFAAHALSDERVQLPSPAAAQPPAEDERLPPKATHWPWQRARPQTPRFAAGEPAQYLGTTSVPLPPAAPPPTAALDMEQQRQQEAEAARAQLQTSYPPFAVGARPTIFNGMPAVSEVHLRRLDRPDRLHRRAVAVITIGATVEDVWKVLTDYESLPEFVPNLAVSERVVLPSGGPPNLVRLRQVGFKAMAYMMLHGESTLDLVEIPGREIQFRQVSGDFLSLQGKFMLSADEPVEGAEGTGKEPRTVLKYAVEIVLPRAARMLGLLEPVLERVVYEDVPANLTALKNRIEGLKAQQNIQQLESQGEVEKAEAARRRLERPRPHELASDLSLLCAELQRCFGDLGYLPSRADLRAACRTDLERAIAAHGGSTVVAKALGWRPKNRLKRPNGYWDSIDNVRREMEDFIEEANMTPGVMPLKNDFVRAGRLDLAKVVERWGGLSVLAGALGYALERESSRGSAEWRAHIAQVAVQTGLSGKYGLFELAAKTYKGKGGRRRKSTKAGRPKHTSVTNTVDVLGEVEPGMSFDLEEALDLASFDGLPAPVGPASDAATVFGGDGDDGSALPATGSSSSSGSSITDSFQVSSSIEIGGGSAGDSAGSSGSSMDPAPDLYGNQRPGLAAVTAAASVRRTRFSGSGDGPGSPAADESPGVAMRRRGGDKSRPRELRRVRREIDSW